MARKTVSRPSVKSIVPVSSVAASPEPTVTQLTLFEVAPWSDDQRGQPNDLARSALFTTRNKREERQGLDNVLLYSYAKDVKIVYTGIELRAEDDELVWQQVLEYAKRYPLGSSVYFSLYELCVDLGWSINGRYYDKAEQCLSRLQAGAMRFSSKRLGDLESLSLIERFRIVALGSRKARCEVSLHKEIVGLFGGGTYSKYTWVKYRELTPTARRLFDYFVSHREPFALKLDSFQKMCGSLTKRPGKWKEQVSLACAELIESGLVENAWVKEEPNGPAVVCER